MLDAFRHATGGQVCTQPLHIWKVTGKPCLLVYFDGELACDEVRPAGGQARQAQVGDSVSIDVVCGECALGSLQLCVERQRCEPQLRRVADLSDGSPRVPHQEPSTVLEVRDDLCHPIGPAGRQPGGKRWFEPLNARALLEPDDTVGSGHARHGRPRTLMYEHRRSRELNVRRNPLDHRGDDSDAKRATNPDIGGSQGVLLRAVVTARPRSGSGTRSIMARSSSPPT